MNTPLIQMLKVHEGLRLFPYRCSAGKLTIGVGRNLEDVGISEEEAEMLLVNDAVKAVVELEKYRWFHDLDDVRKDALTDFMFNVGANTFSKFKNMIAAVESRDFEKAADELLDSNYARQVGRRAHTISEMIRTGRRPNL